MKFILSALASVLFVQVASAATLTSDATYDYLEVATGAVLNTGTGFNITVGGGTGATMIYGVLDARTRGSNSTIITQTSEGFKTSVTGSGAVYLTGTGYLLLTGAGSDVDDPYELTVFSGAVNSVFIDNGLVGYWKFDEGAGTTAKDSSRYGNDGTLANMVAAWTGSTATQSGAKFYDPYALDFDGSNDYIDTGESLPSQSEITVSLWIKTANLYPTDSAGTLISRFSTVSGNRRWIFWSNGGDIEWGDDTAAELVWSGGESSVEDNNWHLLTATVNSNGDGEIFLDGVSKASEVGTFNISGANENIIIGGYDDGAQANVGGIIDDVRIYNRALSASEVAQLAGGYQYTGSGFYVLGAPLEVNEDLAIYSGGLDLGTSNSLHPDETASGQTVAVGRNFINHAGFESGSGSVNMGGMGNSEVPTDFSHSNRVYGSSHFQNFSKVGSTGTGEYYTGHALGQTVADDGVGTDILSITVDRSNESETKDFIVIASWAIGSEDVSDSGASGSLIIDGVEQHDHDFIEYDGDDDVYPEMTMTKISLDATSHTVKFRAVASSSSATDQTIIEGLNLIVWEMPAWMTYNEDLTVTLDDDNDEAWNTKLDVTYDAFAEDVLIVATVDVAWIDEGDPGGIRLLNDGTEVMRHEPSNLWDSANDGLFHPVSLIALAQDQNGRDLVASLQYKDGGTSDDTSIKNARIFTIPVASFDAARSTSTDQTNTTTSYADLVTSSSQASGSYIVFFGSQHGHSVGGSVTDMQIKAPPGETYELEASPNTCTYDGTDSGSEPCSFAHVWGATGSGGSAWELEFKSSSGPTHNADRNSIVVIETGTERNSLTIDHTARQNFSGSLVMYGDDVSQTIIRSSSGGVQALFNSTGSFIMDYLDVEDNDASLGQTLHCGYFPPDVIDNDQCTFSNTTNWQDIGSAADQAAFTKIFEDYFTEASNVLLSNHTPDIGTSWTEVYSNCDNESLIVNASSDFVQGNSPQCFFYEGGLYTADATYGSADYVVEIQRPRNVCANSYGRILAARVQDSENMYALLATCVDNPFSPGILYSISGGTPTELDSQQFIGCQGSAYVYLRVVGNTISAGCGRPSQDDGLGNPEYVEHISVTDSTHSSAGKAGLGVGDVYSISSFTFSSTATDNFRVYTTEEEVAAEPTPVQPGSYIMFME